MHMAEKFADDTAFDMYHVGDPISDAYYEQDMSRFNVDISDNFLIFPLNLKCNIVKSFRLLLRWLMTIIMIHIHHPIMVQFLL